MARRGKISILHKVFLVIEVILILLPVSFYVLVGGVTIIVTQITGKTLLTLLPSILITFITILLIASVISLWLVLIQTLRNKIADVINLAFLLINIGALATVLLYVIFITNLFDLYGDLSHLGIYLIGAPVLLPYLHLLYINRVVLKKTDNKYEETNTNPQAD